MSATFKSGQLVRMIKERQHQDRFYQYFEDENGMPRYIERDTNTLYHKGWRVFIFEMLQ